MKDINKIIEQKERQKKTFKDFLLDLFDLISFLVFVWGLVLFVRFFLFNPYTVVWQSMEPTFEQKDFIIVDKITPRFGDFERWDIIVFVPPWKDVPYIKRIIGLPWEKVKIQSWDVFICDDNSKGESCRILDESYLPVWLNTSTKKCWKDEFNVESWGYFVLWDNRPHSTDSRCCFGIGCYNGSSYTVPEKYIIWKVYVRLFPSFDKF